MPVAKIALIAPAPPPLTGQTAYSLYLRHWLSSFQLIDLTRPSRARGSGVAGYLRKIFNAIGVIFEILSSHPFRIAFIVLDGRLGLLCNALYLLALRLRQIDRVFLSHHSYSYIESPSVCMRLLLLVAGRERTTHLFLCNCMMRRFSDLYGGDLSYRVLSNARRLTVDPDAYPRHRHAFTIGYLSNISFEKGIREYFQVMTKVISAHADVVGVIAGPCESLEVRRFVESQIQTLGGRVEWRGPVYEDAKWNFLRSISILLFPTSYTNEAQPNVLFEALAFGVPCATVRRGCIEEDLRNAGSLVVTEFDTFVEEAWRFIDKLIDEHRDGRSAERSREVRMAFEKLSAISKNVEVAIEHEIRGDDGYASGEGRGDGDGPVGNSV